MADATEPLRGPGALPVDVWRRARRAAADPSLRRFVVAGALSTALGFVLFHGFHRLYGGTEARAGLAQASAYAVGIALTFGVNRSWTFRSSGDAARQLPRFAAAHLSALGVSSLLMQAGVAGLGMPATPWWVLVTGCTTVMNFLLQRYWVFASR